MPKLLILLTAASVASLLAWRRAHSRADEQDLWAHATTTPDLR